MSSTAITLNEAQARFAADAIAAGRYRDVADVVAAGLAALQRLETRRADLLASVLDAEAEGDREGYLSIDDVEAEMRAVIQEQTGADH